MSEEQVERRLAAILADVAGYSRLKAIRRELLDPKIKEQSVAGAS